MGGIPGILYTKKPLETEKIALKENPVAGFVGITRKGPLNKAVKIQNFNDFLKTFGGFDTAGNLPFGVYSFFQNGGRCCHIVRIAHREGSGGAACASFILMDQKQKKVAKLLCKSEGIWGNELYLNLWLHPDPSGKRSLVNVSLHNSGFQEDFLGLSADPQDSDYYLDRIQSQSSLVSVESISINGSFSSPEEVHNEFFSGGREGIAGLRAGDFIGRTENPDRRTGLAALEPLQDVNLIAAPDVCLLKKTEDIFAVHTAMITHAETLEGRFALLDLNSSMEPSDVLAYRNRISSSKAALYYPDLKVIDPADHTTFSLAPSCAIAGIVSDVDLSHGCYYPPGNRFIEGAVALSRPLKNDEIAMLYEKGVNAFKKVPGKGIKVWGVRTLAEDPEWRFINVRRTISFLSAAMKKGTSWAVFEPNDALLQKRVVRHVTAYLIDAWRKGYLAGKTANEAFFVRCDSELNPPENREAGILSVQVGLCPVKPAEYIIVTLHAEKEHTKVIIDKEVIHEQ